MNTVDIIVVRIYITESAHLLTQILSYLKNEAQIRGVSVFRAINGFGEHGNHSAALLELSLDLPLVIEFFDSPKQVEPALDYLNNLIKQEHLIFWHAQANA